MFLAETVCTPEGCHEETDVLAKMVDSPWLAIIIGVFALFFLGKFLKRFFAMWKRPIRATIITAAWIGAGFYLWPYVGALPLLGGFFLIVLMPLNILLGWATKDTEPEKCPMCEEYGVDNCSAHGVSR